MHRGLVALSASAVAAVYMAGYLRTQSADASIGAAATATSVVSTRAPAVAAAAAAAGAAAPAVTPTSVRLASTRPATLTPVSAAAGPPATPTAAAAAATTSAAAALADGTYTGQGSSRRGDVWVSVQIQAGRIASVNITRSTLQYPLRDIANLPAQVVQRQSAQVDIVSRATYSSQAFRTAVAQALSKAG
jgi:uncharacterized protein with FMN-binding domain